MPIETVIRPILDTVLDAVVVMDRDGLIRAWNHHAETMFGWTADEAIGRDLGELIVPPALREAHHRGLARFNAEGVGRVLDTRLELAGLRRDGGEIPVELSITLVSREGRDVFVGFLRDLSERRQAERQMEFRLRESQLMLDLSERASRDESFEEVLVATLDSICDLAEWPLGHAFVVAEDDFRLVSTGWSTNAANVAPDLVEATEKEQFTAGVGLPGDEHVAVALEVIAVRGDRHRKLADVVALHVSVAHRQAEGDAHATSPGVPARPARARLRSRKQPMRRPL